MPGWSGRGDGPRSPRPSRRCATCRPIGLTPEALLSTRAWLAARLGDVRAEQDAVTRWLERVPGELTALDRLIALKTQAGRAEEVVALRRRKAELDRASDDYRRTLVERVPVGQFAELGRLAETLGRWFEARGWWTLALRESAPRTRPAHGPGPHRPRSSTIWRRPIARASSSRGTAGRCDGRRHPARRRGPGRLDNRRRRRPQLPRRRPGSSASVSFTRTTPRRLPACPRRWAAAWACSTTTATAGSTSTPSRAARSPQPDPPPAPQGDRLFRNRGDGTFEDVTAPRG